MSDKYVKVDDHVLGVLGPDGAIEHQYTPENLYRQRRGIEAQKAREALLRAAELAEVDELLDACAKLGINKKGRNITPQVPPERLGVYPAEFPELVPPPAPKGRFQRLMGLIRGA